MWLTLLFGATACLFLMMTFSAMFHLRWARRLPALRDLPTEDRPDGSPAPRCSVVVAACDEESRIERTVQILLAQLEVETEVIVVDDRSVDRTGEILQRLSAVDQRLRVIRVSALPEGWLGKCHACHVGAGTVTGDWILFTDADCWLKPDAIARALRVAARDRADHVTLTPGVVPSSPAARAWHLAFLITVADWISGVNRDRPQRFLGVGAFNLVRTSAYRECGGYELLRLTVLDDVKLGLLLRRAGKRTRAFIGGDDTECHWGNTMRGMIQVMEKNYFAAVDYRTSAAVGVGLGGPLLWAIALIGPWTGTGAGIVAGIALLSLAIPAGILARRLAWPMGSAMLTPFVFPLLFYAMLNSVWVTVRQGGVRWRETFYPLDQLRAGNLR